MGNVTVQKLILFLILLLYVNPHLRGSLQVSRMPEIVPQMDSLPGDSVQQRLCILTINKKTS